MIGAPSDSAPPFENDITVPGIQANPLTGSRGNNEKNRHQLGRLKGIWPFQIGVKKNCLIKDICSLAIR